MNALELAEYFENDADGSVSDSEVAYMLRKQHEAINLLREALQDIADDATDPYTDGWAGTIAKNALKDTEEIAK